MSRARGAAGLALTAVAGLLLAACSSGGTPSAGRHHAPPHPSGSTASAPTTTGPATTVPTTQPPTTGSGSSTCQPSQLQVAVGTPNGGAGQVLQQLTLTNTSASTCTLGGYPGLQLVGANGAALPTHVVRGGTTFPDEAANQPPSTVTLAAQQAVVFSLHYEDVPVGTETSCPVSSSVEVTPPNDFGHLVVPLQVGPCGGGTIDVSPVYRAG